MGDIGIESINSMTERSECHAHVNRAPVFLDSTGIEPVSNQHWQIELPPMTYATITPGALKSLFQIHPMKHRNSPSKFLIKYS